MKYQQQCLSSHLTDFKQHLVFSESCFVLLHCMLILSVNSCKWSPCHNNAKSCIISTAVLFYCIYVILVFFVMHKALNKTMLYLCYNNALFVLPSTHFFHSYNCLDDAMVVVVVGIIPYALVFDGLLVFCSLFPILVYPGIYFTDCRRRN